MSNSYPVCLICGGPSTGVLYEAREMMFGLRERFDYYQCARCGCLQIATIPSNLEPYYPPTYYSLQPQRSHPDPKAPRRGWLTGFVVRTRDDYAIRRRNPLGRALHRLFPAPWLTTILDETLPGRRHVRFQLNRSSRILDVGSGTGELLLRWHRIGFAALTGIDAFIPATLEYPGGVRVLKGSLGDLLGEWDLIMFHHSFEHMPDPQGTLVAAARCLAPGGICVLRLPVIGEAWRRYGINWVQLDAPRHLALHTPSSIAVLAERAGLRVDHVEYDSTEFQFWGSEQYLLDIPLFDQKSYALNPEQSTFSPARIEAYRAEANQLNREHCGDQAAFYLRRC